MQMRLARVGGAFDNDPARLFKGSMEKTVELSSALRLVANGPDFHVISQAGYILAANSTGWRAGAKSKTLKQLDPAFLITLHDDLSVTEWYCPASGSLLSVDFHYSKSAAPEDVLLTPVAARKLLDA